jgi:hypothetical protein
MMQNTSVQGSRRASLHTRVSAKGVEPGPLHTKTGPPLPAQAGVLGARLYAEGTSKPREVAAPGANSPTGFSPGWPSMNGAGAGSTSRWYSGRATRRG